MLSFVSLWKLSRTNYLKYSLNVDSTDTDKEQSKSTEPSKLMKIDVRWFKFYRIKMFKSREGKKFFFSKYILNTRNVWVFENKPMQKFLNKSKVTSMISFSCLKMASTAALYFAGKLNPFSSRPGVRSSHSSTHCLKSHRKIWKFIRFNQNQTTH